MDDDLKANGWGVKSVLEVENAFDFLCIFQMFYHHSGRLPLANGLLIVPDGDTPEGSEKVSLKLLYEMFKDTKSHGIVSLQFLCALNIFLGANISLSKNALTELCCNLSFETLSGSRDFNFEAISNLTAEMSFQMKHSTLLNLKRKSEQAKKSSNGIKNSHEFFQDAETIEKETKQEDDDFIKTVIKFNEIDSAALEQKKNKSTLMNYLMT